MVGAGAPFEGRSGRSTGLVQDLADVVAAHADYSTAHLEDAPGRLPVFRNHDQAVYLRSNARNRDNLARIASRHAREGVPCDRERGLVVADVIRARPDWAIEHALLPLDYEGLRRESHSADREARFDALDALGASYLGELPVFTLEGARSHFTRRFAVVRPAADPSEGP